MYKLETLESKLMATAYGEHIRDLFELHVPEIMTLINTNKKVMLTWHRNKGPEFINQAIKSGIENDFEISPAIDEIKKTTLLRRMASVIQEVGSPPLRLAIGEHFSLVMKWAEKCNSLNEVFEVLKKQEHGMD